MLAGHPEFLAVVERSRRQLRDEGGVSLDGLRRELGISRRGKRDRSP